MELKHLLITKGTTDGSGVEPLFQSNQAVPRLFSGLIRILAISIIGKWRFG